MIKKTGTVKTLLEALPFIKEFRHEVVVIKYGGSAQTSPELKERFAQDVLLMYRHAEPSDARETSTQSVLKSKSTPRSP